jgi:serpin B
MSPRWWRRADVATPEDGTSDEQTGRLDRIDAAPTGAHAAVATLTELLIGQVADPELNLACSGFGLWSALAVLTSGASGPTADELTAMVGIDPVEAAGALAHLDAEVGALDGTDHAVAVWSRVPTYRTWRDALPMVGFAHLDDDADLDAWVHDHTDGMIHRLPVTIDDSTLLALVDALCLQARWATPFSPHRTGPRTFTTPAGPVEAATMIGRFHAAAGGTVGPTTVVDVAAEPGEGGRVLLRLGLGEPTAPPAAVLREVLAGGPAERARLPADQVDLFLPRFTVRRTIDLVPLLAEHAPRCLTDDAELDRISPEPLKVSQAAQEAVVDVDEHGVKAAAVTAMALARAAGPPPAPPTVVEVHLDRPFAYAIVAERTGLPLFAGWVADPLSG